MRRLESRGMPEWTRALYRRPCMGAAGAPCQRAHQSGRAARGDQRHHQRGAHPHVSLTFGTGCVSFESGSAVCSWMRVLMLLTILL
jgi:hypothetical protein